MKKREKKSQKLNNLKLNLFELTSVVEFSRIYMRKNKYEEENDLLFYENYYCFLKKLT